MKSGLCHELLMPQGSYLFCFAKKGNPKKATPTFALIRDLERKRRAIRNSLRSNNGPLHRRFHSKCRIRANVGVVKRKLLPRGMSSSWQRPLFIPPPPHPNPLPRGERGLNLRFAWFTHWIPGSAKDDDGYRKTRNRYAT